MVLQFFHIFLDVCLQSRATVGVRKGLSSVIGHKTLRAVTLLLVLTLLVGCGEGKNDAAERGTVEKPPAVSGMPDSGEKQTYEGEISILLSDDGVLVDGQAAVEDKGGPVYLAHDIIYYEDRDAYDSGNAYGEGTDEDKHPAAEAAAHTVVHIAQPGTYRISGTLSRGQIAVDLGDGAKQDPNAVVALVLDGADITCTVAPAVMFYQVYECDAAWVAYEEGETDEYTASAQPDTASAGANVILADGSVNYVDGAYVARIYKDNGQEEKLHKYDAAFYSKMSMNVNGEAEGTGVLNITASNEGLDTELHLTVNGGRINIQADNDGINTNEDNVSVTAINGGELHIVAGLGEEGDGVDSNGYLVINGGVVIAIAKPAADSGLDADLGAYINGGWVLATGSTMDWAESDSEQVTMNLQFAAARGADEAIIVTDRKGTAVFAYDPDQDETTGTYNRAYQGAILSCPNFTVGETYYVYVGGSVAGTEENGLYDPASVTGFEGAVRQNYTGTDVGMMFGGGGAGGQRPNGEMPPEDEKPPEDWEPGERPGGQEPPGGWNPGERPGGQEPPEGGKPGQMPGGRYPGNQGEQPQPGEGAEASVNFYLTDKVNAFSGICDETT